MIKKLQIKFILATMASLLAVLLVIMVGINAVNFSKFVDSVDETLHLLSTNRGRFPMDDPPKRPGEMAHLSPEFPFETRYFSVLLDGQGNVLQTETANIAAVDAEQAAEMARSVSEGGRDSGFRSVYRYRVFEELQATRVIFLDCTKQLGSLRSFLLVSFAISLAGFLVVLLLVVISSARIIRPITESYEKQRRFVTDAGHELKTPLTIINADSEVLELELGENEWLCDIRRQTKRLSTLTNDLICLARMEERADNAAMIEFPISDVAEEAAESFHLLAQAQQKTLTTQIQPMLSMTGVEHSIQRLIVILLDNALKYSPAGGSIELRLERYGKVLRLSVTNPIISPIEPAQLPLLFDRFYRNDPARSKNIEGHGLGLSIAKAIVSTHGGRIQAASPDPNTLCITAILP